MAYGLKYTLEATSKRYGNAWQLRLYFDGYTGAEVSRDMPSSSPLVLQVDDAGVVRGTSLRFSIRGAADFDFASFYTFRETEIRADLYLGATLKWQGYLLPEQYSEPYIPPPFTASFIASDGLGRLKDVDFEPENDTISQLEILNNCLLETGLTLAYSIALGIHETNHLTTRSPLAQTFVYDACYDGMTCYEVLTDILQLYDAHITQVNNRWFIWRDADLGITRLRYTTALAYDTTEAAPSNLELDVPGADVYPVDILQAELLPAIKNVDISQELGYDGNLLENGDFSGWWRDADSLLEAWTIYYAASGLVDIVFSGDKYWFKLAGYQSVDPTFPRYIEQEISIVNDPDAGGFVLSFETCLLAWNPSADDLRESISPNVRVLVSMTSGASTEYLTQTGWSSSVGSISPSIDSSVDSLTGTEVKIITDQLPFASGTLRVRLYGQQTNHPYPGVEWIGRFYTNVRAYFLMDETSEYPEKLEETFTINSLARQSADEISVITGDAIDIVNKERYYKNKLMLDDDTPTENWTITGKLLSQSLVLQMVRSIAARLYYPRLKLQGTLAVGNDFNQAVIVTHVYNSNILLEVLEMEHDLYADQARVTLAERKAWYEYERWISITEDAITWNYDDDEDQAITRTLTTVLATWTVNSKPTWVSYKVLNSSDVDITSTPASWVSGCKLKLYPGSTNSGAQRTGTVWVGDAGGGIVDITVTQQGGAAPAATIDAEGFTITSESASISAGSTTLSYAFTPSDLVGSDVFVTVYRNGVEDATETLSCTNSTPVSETITVTQAVNGDAYEIILSEQG